MWIRSVDRLGVMHTLSLCCVLQLYKMDASEGSVLQKKYDFRTVPMFLMFYEGKLVQVKARPKLVDIVIGC